MAIAEKQMSSPLMELLPLLLGQKQTTGSTSTSTSTANTAPLQQVFAGAQPLDQAGYEAMITAAFDQAARTIPELTSALANATGTRSSGNSALALGLNEANRRAADAAVSNVLNYNTQQQQIAGNAARGIADSTRSTTNTTNQTQKQGTAQNPLLPVVAGWGLNQFDKMGGVKGVGNVLSGIGDSISNWFNPVGDLGNYTFGGWDIGGQDLAANFGGEWGMSPEAMGGSYNDISGGMDFSGWADTAGDWISDIGSSVGDFAGDAWDAVGEAASGVWDTISGWFADGGMTGVPARSNVQGAGPWNGPFARGFYDPLCSPVMRMMNTQPRRNGYANGGPVGGGMIPTRARAPMQVADRAAMGQDPNMVMQQLLMQSMMPQQVQAPPPSPMNFLRYLLPTSGFNIYQYADGGMTGNRRRYPAGGGYADGGVVRNRNEMGGPVPVRGTAAVTRDPNAMGPGGGSLNSDALMQMMAEFQAQREQQRQLAEQDRVMRLQGIASEIDPDTMTIGTPEQNQAIVEGLLSSVIGAVVPGSGMVLSALGKPSLPTVMAKTIVQSITNPTGVTVGGGMGTGSIGDGIDLGTLDGDGPGTGGGPAGAEGAVSTGVPDQGDVVGSDIGPADGIGVASDADASSDAGDSAPDGVGAGNSGAEGSVYANGGMIRGPGTGTSDSIRATSRVPGEKGVKFSNGEIIIPRDSVEFYGPQFFTDLIMKSHGPARK